MRTLRSPAAMQAAARRWRREGRRVGLVPTMGALHAGHLSLVALARRRCDVVVLSLFVNPTQFGPREDLARYPRPFARDARLCRAAGVDVLFCPPASAMYPADPSTWVDEERLSRGLCGARRPGHFRGVATVVAKLFHLVLPDVAVFGEKDAQQLRVVRRMVRDLDFPVRIVAGPTVREPDGLAMSSRNAYLPPPERADARCLARALAAVRRRFSAGERSAARLRSAAEAEIRPVASARIDYVEVVDDATLEPVRRVARPALVALAVFVGRTRLIDNAVLRPPRRARRARTG